MNITHEGVNVVGMWAAERIRAGDPDTWLMAILFGGDRLACCDEAFVARDRMGSIIGAITISHMGEMHDGQPTLVGLYVVPARRREGIGTALIRAAVERMRSIGLVPVRVDALSEAAKALAERIQDVEVHVWNV